MRKILIGLFIFINISCFSQSVKELEYELSYHKSNEKWGNKKDIAFQLLKIDSLNVKAINYLVEVYGKNDQRDSIVLLFDRLIKENPESPLPYLIRAREHNAYFAELTYTQRINYLKEAHKLDSVNYEAIYTLGKLYYELFIKEFKKNKNNTNLDYYSKNAIEYFSTLCNLNDLYKETLRFPLIQLANYKGNIKLRQYYENYTVQSSYFPISAFADLPNDWKTNYTVNVIDFYSDSEYKLSGIEHALFHINWYSRHLKALDEPILRDTLSTKVFRFTWLRTFHKPIVIRLENDNNSITLYWKVANGAGGYAPGKIIKNKKKKLTTKEWNEFIANIISIDFWNLPTKEGSGIGLDGSRWILEGKEFGKYHVVDRWCGEKIESACLKLLELTNLKIKQDDIY